MSRAVRPRVLPSWTGSDSGACWTTVFVELDPTAPKATRRTATMAPPRRADTKARNGARLGEVIAAQCGRAPSTPVKNRRCSRLSLGEARQGAAGRLDVLGAQQRLAHQHGVHADLVELVELLAGRVAGLRDHGLAGGHVGQQLQRGLEVDLEVGEVAVVDAD